MKHGSMICDMFNIKNHELYLDGIKINLKSGLSILEAGDSLKCAMDQDYNHLFQGYFSIKQVLKANK